MLPGAAAPGPLQTFNGRTAPKGTLAATQNVSSYSPKDWSPPLIDFGMAYTPENLLVPGNQQVGLLLGAGASFELGMPLVWHLTGKFKGYFTPAHLRELNAGWRQQGGGFNDSVIELAIDLLKRNDLHYENILGCLQTMSRRPDQPLAAQYWDMYVRMVELVYLLLYHRQCRSLPYMH